MSSGPVEVFLFSRDELTVKVTEGLTNLIAHLDYDLHKYLECDEMDGSNSYPALVESLVDKLLEGM